MKIPPIERVTMPLAGFLGVLASIGGHVVWQLPAALGFAVLAIGAIGRAIVRANERTEFMHLTADEKQMVKLLRRRL